MASNFLSKQYFQRRRKYGVTLPTPWHLHLRYFEIGLVVSESRESRIWHNVDYAVHNFEREMKPSFF